MKYTTIQGLEMDFEIASLTRVMKCKYWIPNAFSNLPTSNITVLEWRAYNLLTFLANRGNKRKRVKFYCDVLTIHKSPQS